jgi:hypothetical protein
MLDEDFKHLIGQALENKWKLEIDPILQTVSACLQRPRKQKEFCAGHPVAYAFIAF